MSVTNTDNRSPDTGYYVCNDSVVEFTGTFRLLQAADVQVILRDVPVGTESTLTSGDYTVTPAGGSYPADSFTVTTNTTYDADKGITLLRNMDATQPSDYGNQGAYLPENNEASFDRNTLLIQQQQELIDRCVKDAASGTTITDPDSYLQACRDAESGAETAEDGAVAALAAVNAYGVYLSAYTDLADAITTLGATEAELIIDTDDTLTGNVTVPSNIALRFVNGNVITTGSNTLSINGSIIAGLFKIFIDSGGTVNGAITNAYVYPQWFGSIGDGSNDDTSAIQSAIDLAISSKSTVMLTCSSGNTNFKTTSTLSCSSGVSIIGSSINNVNILCVGCDGISFAAGAIRCTLSGFGIAQSVRHTTTPNTYSGIIFLGSTGNRPYWNVIENVFIDGFSRAIYGNWMWETTITQCKTLFCGNAIDLDGVCANNYIHHNGFSGNGICIDFGDGTNTIEGIHVTNNFIDGVSVGSALDWKGTAYCKFNDNVCDFMGAVTAILIRSAGALPTIGNSIRGNYVAFGAAGSEGIRLLNNLASTTSHGNMITENTLFAYASSTMSVGILVDGTQEANNIISKNTINATVYDVNNAGISSLFTDNVFQGGGFNTSTECIYSNNTGSILSAVNLLTKTFGKTTEYFGSAQPVAGSYNSGDFVRYTGLSVDVNNMVLTGWIRLTTGNGHVSGTDWAAQYVSHVTPAS